MVSRAIKTFTVLMIAAAGMVSAFDDVQWVRVTALLEPASGETTKVEQTTVPGGVYSLAEVGERGLASVDQEILERIRHHPLPSKFPKFKDRRKPGG